jgi:integrase/recombinase XerD
MQFLKSFFNALHRENIVNQNPVNNVKLMKVDEDTFQPLTDEEIRLLLSAPDEREYSQFRDKVAMYLMLDSGMRVHEVFTLEVSEVDIKTRSIILPAKKNKNRIPRILPLSNEVVKMLMELIEENIKYRNTIPG